MDYIGLDVHSKYSTLQHITEDGALGLEMTVTTTSSEFSKYLALLDAPSVITFEASRSYWWLYQYFSNHPKIMDVHVVDPRRSRNLSKELSVKQGYGRAKTDRIDAEMLAELSRRDLAPKIQQLELRTLNRHRFSLIQQITLSLNRIYAILSMHGATTTKSILLGDIQATSELLSKLPDYVSVQARDLIDQINLYNNQIETCENTLDELLPESHSQIKLLMTIPGFGIVCSRTVYTEIFDISHFDAPKNLISYAGLAPVEHRSAGKQKGVKLNKFCNYYLKYALMIVAHTARTHPKFQRKYQHDIKIHNKTIAKLNIARRLAKTVYWMLTHQQPFNF